MITKITERNKRVMRRCVMYKFFLCAKSRSQLEVKDLITSLHVFQLLKPV